jgi:hypothetical protein
LMPSPSLSLSLSVSLSRSWLGMYTGLMVVGLPARVRVKTTPLGRRHHHLSLALLHQIWRQGCSNLQVEIFFLHVYVVGFHGVFFPIDFLLSRIQF